MNKLQGSVDSIYFFMMAGWEKEFRSNRWHYASRWAKHIPVIFVLEDSRENWGSKKETRIENCRVLKVKRIPHYNPDASEALFQTYQISEDMKSHGFERPVFWMYNPNYLLTWQLLPAVLRIYHATENHFQYENNSPNFERLLKAALCSADAVICCSDGVRETYSKHTNSITKTLANGCEYKLYSSGVPNKELKAIKKDYNKLIVYAGNVDDRLNISLLIKMTKAAPKDVFVLYGKIHFLQKQNRNNWRKLVASKNVRYLGIVAPELLPDIYKAADVGVLPYQMTPLLKNNTLPLKTFEMVASGLPVVASHLDMLLPFKSEGIVVTDNDGEFVRSVQVLSRLGLSKEGKKQMRQISAAEDYDVKFSKLIELVNSILNSQKTPVSSMIKYGFCISPPFYQTPQTPPSFFEWFRNSNFGGGILNLMSILGNPILKLFHRTIWPRLPKKTQLWIKNKFYDFIIYDLKY